MKQTIILSVVVGLIAIFNGWIANAISPAFRLPESVAEDVADKIDSLATNKEQTPVVSVEENARVRRVIDGDTIEVEFGAGELVLVRYVGIDTPERATETSKEECFYNEATNRNKELVEGKEVRLRTDVSDTDKYGRLLRYVYVGDEFINLKLVSEGYAEAIKIEPDINKYTELKAAEGEADSKNLGLWAVCAK
jgi:micrococcal nuclease